MLLSPAFAPEYGETGGVTMAQAIKCKACNSSKPNVYYLLDDGPICSDCLKKSYAGLFTKEGNVVEVQQSSGRQDHDSRFTD